MGELSGFHQSTEQVLHAFGGVGNGRKETDGLYCKWGCRKRADEAGGCQLTASRHVELQLYYLTLSVANFLLDHSDLSILRIDTQILAMLLLAVILDCPTPCGLH